MSEHAQTATQFDFTEVDLTLAYTHRCIQAAKRAGVESQPELQRAVRSLMEGMTTVALMLPDPATPANEDDDAAVDLNAQIDTLHHDSSDADVEVVACAIKAFEPGIDYQSSTLARFTKALGMTKPCAMKLLKNAAAEARA